MKLYEIKAEVTPVNADESGITSRTINVDVPADIVDIEDFVKKAIASKFITIGKNGKIASSRTYGEMGDLGKTLTQFKKFVKFSKAQFPKDKISPGRAAIDLVAMYLDHPTTWKKVLKAAKAELTKGTE